MVAESNNTNLRESKQASSDNDFSIGEKAIDSDYGIPNSVQEDVKSSKNSEYEVEDESDKEEMIDRGVYRVEALKKVLYTHKHGLRMRIILGVSIFLCSWAASLDSSVTYSLQPWATSAFNEHSMGLGSLNIANSIISAISKPVWARIANIVSRPATYLMVMLFYVVGYVIVASSSTISAYIVGSALSTAGSSGVDFLNSIIVADMTSLKWRGLATGILAAPYIVNTWYAGYIVSDLGPDHWRWGYGMFCIIIPVTLAPATIIMFVYEHKAHQILGAQEKTEYRKTVGFTKNWKSLLWRVFVEVDVFGLLLIGFSFSLLLLPFSLYSGAEKQWKNPSLIAMFVVGGVLLIAFFVYELTFAPFPIVPKRCLNRTLVASVVIDFIYQLAGMIPLVYLSSFVWIVKDWSNQDWTYYNNTLTVALCLFGVVAGICMRITHRYKIFQYFGVIMAILGQGIMIDGRNASDNTLCIIWSQILSGIGGGFNVVASGVALQASIPHKDMAISISIVSLISSIGASIGSATSTAIWQGKMENSLRKYMPSSVTDTQVEGFFENIGNLRDYSFSSEIRQAGIKAYKEVNFYFYPIALSLQAIRLVAVFFQSNFYLGESQNAVENEDAARPTPNEIGKNEPETAGAKWRRILLGIQD